MMKRIFAVLTAAVLLLSGCAALAEETAENVQDTLLVTVEGIEIRENNPELQSYYVNVLSSMADPEGELEQHVARMDVMNDMIWNTVIQAKAQKEIPAEEAEELREKGRASWEEQISELLESEYGITEESTEEERAEALEDLLTTLEVYYGITKENYAESYVLGRLSTQVENELKTADPSLVAGDEDLNFALDEMIAQEREETAYYAMYLKLSEEDPDRVNAMTDEELDQLFQDMTDEEKTELSNDIAAYETVRDSYRRYGEEFHYIPEGYRGILQILLKVDEELLNAWTDLNARLEENQEDGENSEPVTPEMVEAARQAILDSRKETIDEILGKLQNGAKFEDLVKEYKTDDPAAEGIPEDGVPIHKESILYDAAYTAAAAALEKAGAVSEPVVTTEGIHLLYYLRDIPGGALPLSEEAAAQMKQDIEDERMNLAINELVEQWIDEAEIVWTPEGEAWKEDQSVRDAYRTEQLADADAEDEAAE